MDHGAERSEAPLEQFPGASAPPRGSSSTRYAVTLHITHRGEVTSVGWTVYEPGGDIAAIGAIPVSPFPGPGDSLAYALDELERLFGTHLTLF